MALFETQGQSIRKTRTSDEVFNDLMKISQTAATSLRQSQTQAYFMFWNNPDATPQQLAEKLGTNGVAFFQVSSKIDDVLELAFDGYQRKTIPEQYNVTFNQDGTVIITQKE